MDQRTQFFQQLKALYFKNKTVSWRKKSTLMQLLSPLIIMFLLFILIQQMRNSGRKAKAAEVLLSPPIPPCEESFITKQPCFDFIWTGNSSDTIASIVTRIMANNPGRSIDSSKVISFKTKEEVDDWMSNNPLRCTGAFYFEEITDTIISYGIQVNLSQIPKRWKSENPLKKFVLPFQLAAEREISRFIIGDVNMSWVFGLEQYPRPKKVHSTDEEIEITFQGSAEIFFLAMTIITLTVQIRSLVIEKELRQRQAMTMVGLYDSAYWLSWLGWETTTLLISSLSIVVYGMIFRFPFFLRNNFTILLLTFFLFQLTMTGFAFTVSTLVGSSSTNKIGFFIFFLSFGAQLVKPFLFPLPAAYKYMWLLFPPNIFFKATEEIFSATARGGMSWSEISECTGNCEMAIVRIFQWYIGTFFLWFTIAIYLDNVLPNSSGVRKCIFYFLYPGYWTGDVGKVIKEGGIFSYMLPQVEHTIPYDEDVFEEENTVKQQLAEGLVDLNVAVQVRGLTKTYPGKRHIGCCEGNRKSHFHAIKGLWVNTPKDQLFCLLGPNGAGKTTMISCLTGISPLTSGDALIYGQSIRSSVGMSNIRKLIGVCPQFDILWDALSGEEHLRLFASIKGIPAASIESNVHKSLYQVRLLDAATTRVGGYSGGMKRRLSVAIALIGDPKLVILDEPTTGMDSINRRHVWDIIHNAKKGRAIILTTHSVEEADILSDRIGIMANGTLRCIGTSIHLQSKFGSGFVINVSFTETTGAIAKSSHEALKSFFKLNLNLLPKEETQHFLSYVVPRKKESSLKNIFRELQLREREFGIDEIQLGLTTLEEVFSNIAKKAALENAAIDDRMTTLTLDSGITLLIPVGAEHIGIPGSASAQNVKGLMVEVYWGQDADGNLCISGHSTETPIPDDVDCTLPSTLPKGAPCRGIVLETPLTRSLFP